MYIYVHIHLFTQNRLNSFRISMKFLWNGSIAGMKLWIRWWNFSYMWVKAFKSFHFHYITISCISDQENEIFICCYYCWCYFLLLSLNNNITLHIHVGHCSATINRNGIRKKVVAADKRDTWGQFEEDNSLRKHFLGASKSLQVQAPKFSHNSWIYSYFGSINKKENSFDVRQVLLLLKTCWQKIVSSHTRIDGWEH